jgi:hypothetical protein
VLKTDDNVHNFAVKEDLGQWQEQPELPVYRPTAHFEEPAVSANKLVANFTTLEGR